ncbi:hypothetical protein BRADI_1g24593v3 [Brachypodium distachyon]|uniref:Reverse transcriptase zinc-binding domain-containing protein n=1 Tax=Brachypodium distachyon TaxID=15368 RepID=A0A0Q3RRQ5_BRADI|nr:hypothetical protein BRADI_1g24593v3 [Brachypodium distachyon]
METINHLLVDCPFSRTLWHEVLSWIRSTCAPPTVGIPFADWWQTSVYSAPSTTRKGAASIIILTAQWIWKHCDAAVFDNATPNIASLADQIKTEARIWARGSSTE